MDAEQHKRILGYFLQETREHLALLQQAVTVLEQQRPFQAWAQVPDWFRAAHSVKGGAAMLDLEGVQQVALRLENCLKILRDCPHQRPVALSPEVVDLFRQGLGALETLVHHVEQTGELPFEVGQSVVLAHEPAFIQLEALLQIAVQGEGLPMTWETPVTTAAEELDFDALFAELDQPTSTAAVTPEAPANTPEDLATLAELFALESETTSPADAPSDEELGALAELFTLGEDQPAQASDRDDAAADLPAPEVPAESALDWGDASAASDRDQTEPSTGEIPAETGDLNVDAAPTLEDLEALALEETPTQEAVDWVTETEAELADLDESSATLGELNLEMAEAPALENLDFGATSTEGALDWPAEPGEVPEWLDWAETEAAFGELNLEVDTGQTVDDLETLALDEALTQAETETPELPDLAGFEEAETELTGEEESQALDSEMTLPAELATDASGLLGNTAAELEAALASFAQPETETTTPEPPPEGPIADFDLEQELANLDDLAATTAPDLAEDLDFDLSETGELTSEDDLGLPEVDDLEAVLAQDLAAASDDVGELEQWLSDVEMPADLPDIDAIAQELSVSTPSTAATPPEPVPTAAEEPATPSSSLLEQTMRVPVRQLDNLSNLIGELVVSRNTLSEDQNRLRQFLENLLHQAHQLNDLSQRMQDLYERSLLEGALSAGRSGGSRLVEAGGSTQHSTGAEFDALEMDRFTGFHVLSQEIAERVLRVREAAADIEFMVEAIEEVVRSFQRITTGLQEGINSARMEPFSRVTDRLPRAVRNVALKCGKQVQLEIEGRETLIDKMILEKLMDPMTHLVNNAIVHGIGTPAQRTAAGQSPTGRIVIRAGHQGNQTVITVSDDGVGINPDRVKAKAIERGLITPEQAQSMSKQEVYQLLFMPGFSTKDQADEFAGRGVGLDVVRKNLAEIRGTVVVDSEVGKGTTFTIRLPLTLSISKSLPCLVSHARVAFPMDGVADVPVEVTPQMITTGPDGKPLLEWAGQRIPLRRLSELLHFGRLLGRGNIYGTSTQEGMAIVVVHSLGRYVAFQVDQVLSEQEVVIKQLGGPVKKPLGIAGATILGDGRIMMIADVLELVDLALGQMPPPSLPLWQAPTIIEPETTDEPTVLIVDDSITVREMLSMTFSNKGYRVEQARDGLEAWEKLQDGLPCDLMFCDIEMPRMDGLELLSKVRRDPKLKDLPIAMLTSRGAERHRQMAIQLGANAYFTKPYLEETLLEAARRLLQGESLVKPAN
ncbi:MAG: response regulator [Gloeomargarita sp. SKYBB_i_bin120]|nr:response regulator [Gloeomargarita sp. SKYG98]MCS7292537.1 response regulator [Gloeomargarita sp. SKYB120]MDW8178098.1 response regulator [Gloeomargarita sp. SKYBB_i_bin120]